VPLSCSKLAKEHECDRHIEQLENEKSHRENELTAEFISKQQKLFEQATRDIETEVHQYKGRIQKWIFL